MGALGNGGAEIVAVKLLALVTDAFGGHGGIAQYNRDFCQALALSPTVREIVVLPRLAPGDLGVLPSKLRQLKPSMGRLPYLMATTATVRRESPFDGIFCGHLFHAPLAAFLGRWTGAPVWLQTHGIDAWDCPGKLVRQSAEQSTLITAVSRYTKSRLQQWCNISPDRVRVLPNTVRQLFTPGAANDETLSEYGLTGRKIILTVSRIAKADYYKGHARLIAAMPRVLRSEPDACYVVVGDGDGRADLEQMAAGLNLTPAVKFLGRLSDERVLELYRSSHVFAMPSTKEGFGIVFVEAAASGLPVIAGNRDGSVDALADGHSGQLIDPLSADELSSALIDNLRHRRQPSAHAADRFSFDNFAAHVDHLVQHFANRQR